MLQQSDLLIPQAAFAEIVADLPDLDPDLVERLHEHLVTVNGEAPTTTELRDYIAHVLPAVNAGTLRAYFRMPPDPARPADEAVLRWLEERDGLRRPPRRWTQAEFWARLMIACAEATRPVTAAGIAREFVMLNGTRGTRTRYLKQLARRFGVPPMRGSNAPGAPDGPRDEDGGHWRPMP